MSILSEKFTVNDKITFKVVDVRPVSTNDMYIPTRGARGRGAYLRSSSQLRKFKDLVKTQFEVQKSTCNKELDGFRESPSYVFHLQVSIPKYTYYINSGKRMRALNDASNFIKSIEDAISECLDYNDAKHVRVISDKGYNNSEDTWVSYVTLYQLDSDDYELDLIDKEADIIITK